MHYLLIRNARLASQSVDSPVQSILIADGRIVSIGANLQHPLTQTSEFNADGRWILPSMISFVNPRPTNINSDNLSNLNFEHITSGICSIMTVAPDVTDMITELSDAKIGLLNHGSHLALRQVAQSDIDRLRQMILTEGIASATVRLGDEKKTDINHLTQHIDTACALGLQVIYDLRGLVSSQDRMNALTSIGDKLKQNKAHKALFLGVEFEDELDYIISLRAQVPNTNAQLCFDPFGQTIDDMKKLSAEHIATQLRQSQWCSLGLAYSNSKAQKEGWPDMTPEIIGRNLLPLLGGLPCHQMLSVGELSEFAIERPAKQLGLWPTIGKIAIGSSANIIIWDADVDEQARVDTPRGNFQQIRLRGCINAVILNGQIVLDEKLNTDVINGQHIYARL